MIALWLLWAGCSSDPSDPVTPPGGWTTPASPTGDDDDGEADTAEPAVDCDAEAQAAYDACVASGGLPDDCAAEAEEARSDCEGGAADGCREHSDAIYDDCIDAGGSAVDCARRAEEAYADCVDG